MFVEAINNAASDAGIESILSLPGVYEIVSEEFNNEALNSLADEHDRCRDCGSDTLNDDGDCTDCSDCN